MTWGTADLSAPSCTLAVGRQRSETNSLHLKGTTDKQQEGAGGKNGRSHKNKVRVNDEMMEGCRQGRNGKMQPKKEKMINASVNKGILGLPVNVYGGFSFVS